MLLLICKKFPSDWLYCPSSFFPPVIRYLVSAVLYMEEQLELLFLPSANIGWSVPQILLSGILRAKWEAASPCHSAILGGTLFHQAQVKKLDLHLDQEGMKRLPAMYQDNDSRISSEPLQNSKGKNEQCGCIVGEWNYLVWCVKEISWSIKGRGDLNFVWMERDKNSLERFII